MTIKENETAIDSEMELQQAQEAAAAERPSEEETAMALLSDEEREALTLVLGDEPEADDDDDDDDEPDDKAAEADVKEVEDAEADEDDGADAKETEAAEPADAEPAEAKESAEILPFALDYKLPEDFDEQRAALEEGFAAIEEELDTGDISTAEYVRKLRELTREEAKLDDMQRRHDYAVQAAEHAKEAASRAESAAWDQAIASFTAEAEQAGIEGTPDYRNDEKIGFALGTQVQAILAARGHKQGDPVPDKMELLRQAHREIYYRINAKPLPETGGGVESKKAEVKSKRKAKVKGVPTALSQVQGSGGNDVGATGEAAEFESILALDGAEYEAAVASLQRRNPAKFERFLAS